VHLLFVNPPGLSLDQEELKIAIAPNAFISAALQDNTECLSVKSDLDAYRRGTTMSIGVNNILERFNRLFELGDRIVLCISLTY
jgi:hypothetical protein